MAIKHPLQGYRDLYAKLLRLYPTHYYDRFGESMEQTFNDLLRERAHNEGDVLRCATWMYLETFAVIIRENISFVIMKNKRLIGMLLAVAALLLVPLVAMQYTSEVMWTLGDFIFAGVLLGGTSVALEYALRTTADTAYRVAFAMGLAGAFFLVWINGAVGIIGNENNPANMLYASVLIIGFFGSVVSLFKPKGMSRTLFAAAIAQALVPIIALAIWQPDLSSTAAIVDLIRVIVLNMFFVAMFLGSGLLFQRAVISPAKTHKA